MLPTLYCLLRSSRLLQNALLAHECEVSATNLIDCGMRETVRKAARLAVYEAIIMNLLVCAFSANPSTYVLLVRKRAMKAGAAATRTSSTHPNSHHVAATSRPEICEPSA